LGSDRGYFPRVREVVVFPSSFRTPVRDDDWEDDGLSDSALSGQAVDRGPVLLAWDEVLPEGRNPAGGFNVVIHEFVHQLDFFDGATAGVPALGDRELESRWRYVMSVAYADHCRAVRDRDPGAFFTPHAADNEAEFLADATEAFFCRPMDLREMNDELYRLLAAYHRVDPAAWFAGRG
jgi:hypothetical protein